MAVQIGYQRGGLYAMTGLIASLGIWINRVPPAFSRSFSTSQLVTASRSAEDRAGP